MAGAVAALQDARHMPPGLVIAVAPKAQRTLRDIYITVTSFDEHGVALTQQRQNGFASISSAAAPPPSRTSTPACRTRKVVRDNENLQVSS